MSGLLDGIKKLGKKGEQQNESGQQGGALKRIHLVELGDNNEVGARQDVNIEPGTTVEVLRKKLGIDPKDAIIRGKNRQLLKPDVNIYDLLDEDEKLTILPNAEVGLR